MLAPHVILDVRTLMTGTFVLDKITKHFFMHDTYIHRFCVPVGQMVLP